MKDAFEGITAFAVMIAGFLLWCYGIAVCWRADELFWAVVSFALFPVGVLIGLFNLVAGLF